MWECSFAGEAMDYKLFWLRFAKKIWFIVAATILGALIVGVPYYLVNVTFGPGPEYKVVSEYYLDYAEDSSGATYDYFNYYTWSEIVDTDEFISILRDLLPEEMFANDETLRAYTDATVESDTRYLTTTVKTEHPNKTLTIARTMEQAIGVFADGQKELNSVKVVTAPQDAEKTYPDVRTMRAVILGAIIGLFVGLIAVCTYIICDSSVFLPNTMEKRYGIKALGCKSFTETKNNVCYATKDAKNVALLWAGKTKGNECEEAVNFIKECFEDGCSLSIMKEDVLSGNFDFEKVRKLDAVILLIEAGAKNGKKIERIIEQIRRQDIKLSGAFLFGEDEKLIKRYYR